MNRVVLVDDEVYARQGLKNLIDWEQCGYQVCDEAENGEEALDIIRSTSPDLIITDIRMPVLDGLELIRSVREGGNSGAKFIIISGYSDFKYAQQAIKFGVQDFILKPIDEVELKTALLQLAAHFQKEKRLQNHRDFYLARSVLEKLLTGEFAEREIGGMADVLGLDRSGDFFYFIAEVNGIQTPGGEEASEEQVGQIKSVVRQIVSEEYGNERQIHLYEQRRGVYGFLLASRRPNAARGGELEALAERVCRRLRNRLKKIVCLYAGNSVERIEDVKDAFQTSNQSMRYKFAFSERQTFHYGSVKGHALHNMEIEQSQYALLMERMEEHDAAAMEESIERIFLDFQNKRFAPEAVKNSIVRCVCGVVQAIQNMQGDEKQLRSLEPIMQWDRYPLQLAGLKRLFRKFIMECAQVMADLRRENARGDVGKIKAYIEAHYQENISLKSIAARFYINPVYLGQLFKKTYGAYFNDFVLQLRVKEAKQLLRQTDLRVYEIAERVGYSNPDYFVTQFEKVEHKTPTEYRHGLLEKCDSV